MCGIVGFINTYQSGASLEGEIMRDLVTAGTVRGHDGTGIFLSQAKTPHQVTYMKKPVTGAALLEGKSEWIKLCRDSRFLVGHNRAATSGSLDEESTHPFVFDNLVGVHNGTITAWRGIFKGVKAEMDSAALYESLDGLDNDSETVTKFLATLGSEAYALVWYDMRSKRLCFARNRQRPLHFAQTFSNTFFASEPDMLTWVLGRRSAKILRTSSLEVHTLLTLPMDGEGEPEVTEYKPEYKAVTSSVHTGGYYGGWNNGGYDNYNYNRDDSWDSWADRQKARDEEEDDKLGTKNAKSEADKVTPIAKPPQYIDITEFGKLPEVPAFKGIKAQLYSAANTLAGAGIVSADKKTDFLDLEDAIAANLMGEEDANIDLDFGSVKVAMHVCRVDPIKELMYGYLQLKGEQRLPMVVRCFSPKLRAECSAILLRLYTAKVLDVKITGIRLYSNGQKGFTVSPILTDFGVAVEPGRDLKGGKGLGIQTLYGISHPAQYAEGGVICKADWNAGWKSKAVLH